LRHGCHSSWAAVAGVHKAHCCVCGGYNMAPNLTSCRDKRCAVWYGPSIRWQSTQTKPDNFPMHLAMNGVSSYHPAYLQT
jgi:hypothetical protein